MKKGLLLLLLVLVASVAAYSIMFHSATHSTHSMLQTSAGEMEWLRREYHLNQEQFEKIQGLHRDYRPTCDRLCSKVAEANAHLEELVAQNKTLTPEIEAALKKTGEVQEECRRAMLGHVYAVSAQMNPEDGARYLQLMLPHIIQRPIAHEAVMAHSAAE